MNRGIRASRRVATAFRAPQVVLSLRPSLSSRSFSTSATAANGGSDSSSNGGMSERTLRLAKGLMTGDRACLAQAITLMESSRSDHRRQADLMQQYLFKHRERGMRWPSGTFRLGIAGPPGAGKSSLIEALGMKLVGLGHRVAVIPVDPSSQISGGSILGDKTRMEQLSRSEQAYVRASPTRCALGGIAEYTSDVVSVCESAGYDTVIVESVGLGQSETELDQAVDLFVLVIPPVAGDDLQASKKGIMEVADLVVVNKADGDLVALARQTVCDYASSVRFIRPKHSDWSAKIMMLSARTGTGVDEFIENMKTFSETMAANRGIAAKRGKQAKYWMWANFQRHILESLHSDEALKAIAHRLEASLEAEAATPRAAAETLFDAFVAEKSKAAGQVLK